MNAIGSAFKKSGDGLKNVVTLGADRKSSSKHTFELSQMILVSGLSEKDKASGLIVQCKRGSKMVATKVVPVNERTRASGVTWGLERMRFVATLFSNKQGKRTSKAYTLSVLDERTNEVARCDVDITPYADATHPQERRLTLKRVGGGGAPLVLDLRIAAQKMKSTSSGDDDDDTDSMGSFSTASSKNEQDLTGFVSAGSFDQQADDVAAMSKTFKKTPSPEVADARARAEARAYLSPKVSSESERVESQSEAVSATTLGASAAGAGAVTSTFDAASPSKSAPRSTSFTDRGARNLQRGLNLSKPLSKPLSRSPSTKHIPPPNLGQDRAAAATVVASGAEAARDEASESVAMSAEELSEFEKRMAASRLSYATHHGGDGGDGGDYDEARRGAPLPREVVHGQTAQSASSPPALSIRTSSVDSSSGRWFATEAQTAGAMASEAVGRMPDGLDDLGTMRRELSTLRVGLLGLQARSVLRDSSAEGLGDDGRLPEETSAQRDWSDAEEDSVLMRAKAMLGEGVANGTAAGRATGKGEGALRRAETAEELADEIAVELRQVKAEREELRRRLERAEAQAAEAQAELAHSAVGSRWKKAALSINANSPRTESLRQQLIDAKLAAAQAAYERDMANAKLRFVLEGLDGKNLCVQ